MDHLTIIQKIAVWILPVIFAVTVHETAHGWVAKKYGDNTASLLGRLTLNPIKHIDLLGTIIIPGILIGLSLFGIKGFIFGWAKPVPVNTKNFKNPLRDMAVVALAGPVSNLLMAVGWALLARIGIVISPSSEYISMPLIYMGFAGISINLSLAMINLLPILPLDGGRILTGILPHHLARQFSQLERYGLIILLALAYTNVLNFVLDYPLHIAQNLFMSIAGLS